MDFEFFGILREKRDKIVCLNKVIRERYKDLRVVRLHPIDNDTSLIYGMYFIGQ